MFLTEESLNHFSNLFCYEEFEIQSTMLGISKVDILKEIGCKIDDYYLFISNNGIFNWFDLKGNHVKDPRVLKTLKNIHIRQTITKCIIPNSVTSIDKYAFYGCKSLKEITIPDSVKHIGYGTFCDCSSLTSITIPNNVKSIGKYAFYGCKSLKEITIPDGVTSIGNSTFSTCESLTSITISDRVTSIGAIAFVFCKSLTSITIPYSVKSIDTDAFLNCESLKEVTFKGKTLKEVKQMKHYPFGIKDESIFKTS